MSWNPVLVDGPVPVPTEWNAEGAPVAWMPGYHLNLAPWLMRDALAAFVVTPEVPARCWAGEEPTLFLRFADEAEARGALAELWAGASL